MIGSDGNIWSGWAYLFFDLLCKEFILSMNPFHKSLLNFSSNIFLTFLLLVTQVKQIGVMEDDLNLGLLRFWLRFADWRLWDYAIGKKVV